MSRDQSKSSLITTIEDERRHLLTIKKEDREQRLIVSPFVQDTQHE